MRNDAAALRPFSTGLLDSGLEAPRRPMTRRLVRNECPARLRAIALTILDDHNGGSDEPKFVPSDESVGLRGCRLLARKPDQLRPSNLWLAMWNHSFPRSAADLQKPYPQ